MMHLLGFFFSCEFTDYITIWCISWVFVISLTASLPDASPGNYENKTHRKSRNSCGTSSTMKHEGFHLGYYFLRSFVFKGINHSTKSSHVWRLVMIHATGIPVRCASNTINVNKWNFTSLVSKVASIGIAPFSPNETMVRNWDGVCIPIMNGTWIPLSSLASWKQNTSSGWLNAHVRREMAGFWCKH